MKAESVTVYEVRESEDKIEDRLPRHHVAYCKTRELAEEMASGLGPMGQPGVIIETIVYERSPGVYFVGRGWPARQIPVLTRAKFERAQRIASLVPSDLSLVIQVLLRNRR